MTTRRQHYVWQHYLKGWQDDTGKICCLRNGKSFRTNPSNIMVERDFYKVPPISNIDVAFLESFFISRTPKNLRPIHRNLLKKLKRITEANAILQKHKGVSTEDKKYAKSLVIQIEEQLHQAIEGEAVPILDQLRSKKTDFLDTMDTASAFFHYIGHQYMRTKKIHKSIEVELTNSPLGDDFSHLTNFVCHFGAVNLGASLYVDRRDLKFTFLENTTDVGFITGDQPLVNLLATPHENPEELVVFYPLNSRLSLLMSPREYTPTSIHVTDQLVKYFNCCIAWNSRDSLVSDSESDLEVTHNNRPSQHPSFHDQFDVLQ